jgi:hypothetical protein
MLYGHQIVFGLPVIKDLTYILRKLKLAPGYVRPAAAYERTDSFIAKSIVKANSHLSVCIQRQFNNYPLC